MQCPAALPGPRGYQGPLKASGNGAFGTSPEESLPAANNTTVGKAFMLRRLLFRFRSFSSLLLITSPRTARLA